MPDPTIAELQLLAASLAEEPEELLPFVDKSEVPIPEEVDLPRGVPDHEPA
jgi:hypothetical protein